MKDFFTGHTYKFEEIINDYKTVWEDCSMCFVCECGKEVMVDSQNGLEHCECGRTYVLSTSLSRYSIDWDATHEDLREG